MPEPSEPSVAEKQTEPSAKVSTEGQARSGRSVQCVSTVRDRVKVVHWMMGEREATGEKHLVSKTVRHFGEIFRGNEKANLQKASRWWRAKDSILNHDSHQALTRRHGLSLRKPSFKVMGGRGRRRAPWVSDLYKDLLDEVMRLRTAGLRVNLTTLKLMCLQVIRDSTRESYHSNLKLAGGGEIESKITTRWVQEFAMKHGVPMRYQAGRLAVSPEKNGILEKQIAYHLGNVKRGFESGALNEDYVECLSAAHFVFNMEKGHTLGFCDSEAGAYPDFATGCEGVTLVLRMSGGKNSKIETPFLVFGHPSNEYPIPGLPDDVPGACYRTGPKGWMDRRVFSDYLRERRAMPSNDTDNERVIFLDDFAAQGETEEQIASLKELKTSLRFLPVNTASLTHPADSLVMEKVKQALTAKWGAHKLKRIEAGAWKKQDAGATGEFQVEDRKFFLTAAAETVREINLEKNSQDITYARRGMIGCGLALDLNGSWNESQLLPALQEIVSKHRTHFEGEPAM